MTNAIQKRRPIISPELRKQAGSALIKNLFAGLGALVRLDPRSKPEKHGVRHLQDIPYISTGNTAHTLDLFIPTDSPGPHPVVFYVHGGGFRILSKDTHFGMAMQFARKGYLVVNINYRLSEEQPFPAAFQDSCQAYCWMCENIEDLGGDLSRVIVAGESAGANLVTSLTIAACYEREEPFARAVYATEVVPRVSAAACGIHQVSNIERFTTQERVPSFLADRLQEVSRGYLRPEHPPADPALDFADPLVFFERAQAPQRPLPAFFLPVGTRDILLDDTRRLGAALTRMGVANRTCYYPGEVHAFHAFVWREQAKRCWKDQFEFLDEHLG
ncbi:alpha/beta hydrolase [Bradymonas sediminis]|uniref:Uncharacterized protein n=1 Tax=Bradymonas sediminis TaxID=1548548 RepID=A0A2Z4FGI3_9DELT|nr:alpha/beta hydrolase [Bradymonas sediminis]AWV88092.1 hypothetical protein DN745_01585 [Bradymonas sediminis]TDP77215.1 acetyl esterase [Bradymonas sediminis]